MGATVQCASVWMLALVHLGNRLQKREVWGWLLAGLLIWAPHAVFIAGPGIGPRGDRRGGTRRDGAAACLALEEGRYEHLACLTGRSTC